jgi:hypothetical protein
VEPSRFVHRRAPLFFLGVRFGATTNHKGLRFVSAG